MGKRSPNDDEGDYTSAGMAMQIPSLLLAGPLVGLGIAWLVKRLTGYESMWLTVLLVMIGLVAGAHEVIKVIKRISREN